MENTASITDLAWAAGLFEGEGAITRSGRYPRLALKMVDPEPVHRFAGIIGTGKVYGPYKNRAKDGYARSDFMFWVATGVAGREAFELMRPWLSSYRLKRFAEVYSQIT